ncbi:MAG: spore cortex biosynthesis protein YabQ [Lachnospiraceae bacterium]|nr:spore cortex biosynthesis protein YabQ [Lachnospiraceae bacterium]
MSFHDAEWRLIGRAFLLGFSESVLYDFLRLLRRLGKQGQGITFLCDVVFACFTATASFLVLQRYSNGMLRWYAVGAVCLEIWLYGKIRKIFLTKAFRAVIMKIHPKRKEADRDDTGI